MFKYLILLTLMAVSAFAVIPDDSPTLPVQFSVTGKTVTCQFNVLNLLTMVGVQCSDGFKVVMNPNNSNNPVMQTGDILVMIYKRATDGKIAFECSASGTMVKSGFLQRNTTPPVVSFPVQ